MSLDTHNYMYVKRGCQCCTGPDLLPFARVRPCLTYSIESCSCYQTSRTHIYSFWLQQNGELTFDISLETRNDNISPKASKYPDIHSLN